jgi:hypothetical protein
MEPLILHHQIETLPTVEFIQPLIFSYFGHVDDVISLVKEYLTVTMDSQYHPTIINGCQELLQLAGSPACWFTIRLSRPHNEYKLQRWHRDGSMFTGNSYKIAVTLCGPPTMLLEKSLLVDDVLMKYPNCGLNRLEKTELLKDCKRIELAPGQLFTFTCGRSSPVHSEPDITTNRIFMSIVPGTVAEIKEMAERREQPFGIVEYF